jgi:hypothetical protein
MYGRVNDKDKADVYTFGVVLLELITGCRAIEPERLEGKDQLTIWVCDAVSSQKQIIICVPKLMIIILVQVLDFLLCS